MKMSRKTKASLKKGNGKSFEEKENVVDIFEDFANPSLAEYVMHFEKNRVNSFQNWPFDPESQCNPTTLASAGFYHIPTNESPDAVRCFLCFKELDGWESEDCPRAEHKKHSPHCAFLALKKSVLKLTVDEFLELECKRLKNKVEKLYHARKALLKEQATHVKTELNKL